MNKLLQLLRGGHRPDIEALSARLDGRLGGGSADAMTAHLLTCDACRLEFAAMSHVRDALRGMPSVEQPRSFRLRQADVERVPARASGLGRAMRLVPAVGAVAAAVFVGVVALDLVSNAGTSNSTSSLRVASAPRPQTAERNAAGSQFREDTLTAPSAPDATAAAVAAGAVASGGQPSSGSAEGTVPGANDVTSDGRADGTAPPPSEVPLAATTDKVANPSPTPELSAASSRHTDSDDGLSALRVIEIVAAAVAIGAAVAATAWRMRSRGEQS